VIEIHGILWCLKSFHFPARPSLGCDKKQLKFACVCVNISWSERQDDSAIPQNPLRMKNDGLLRQKRPCHQRKKFTYFLSYEKTLKYAERENTE
jgi:hypothetical protein